MYDCFEYTRPIWDTSSGVMLHESFLPVGTRTVSLLYPIDEVISVMNAEQTVTFDEGADYILEDGRLVIPETSRIRVYTDAEFNPPEIDEVLTSGRGFEHIGGGYVRFAEGSVFHEMQYEVSYRHSGRWDGPQNPFDAAKLPNTRRLLREGRPLRLGFFGDSISAGANASGRSNVPPFMPMWTELVRDRLAEVSGSKIAYRNASRGGMASQWGRENVATKFADFPCDLFVIAFGMNDATGGYDRYKFRDNCRMMASEIEKLSPACEFVFVSTTMPNPEAKLFSVGKDHDKHEALLYDLADEYGDRAAVAPMTAFHKHLLTKKAFCDMTGNNVNHPNDFLIRVYAQVLLGTIVGEF